MGTNMVVGSWIVVIYFIIQVVLEEQKENTTIIPK